MRGPRQRCWCLQPETTLDDHGPRCFRRVPRQGGTLIVARRFAGRGCCTCATSGSPSSPSATGVDGATHARRRADAADVSHYRVRAEAGDTAAVTAAGDWVALRMPYKQGALIVLGDPATPDDIAGLRDQQDGAVSCFARCCQAAIGRPFVVDEAHHSFTPSGWRAGRRRVNQLLFDDARLAARSSSRRCSPFGICCSAVGDSACRLAARPSDRDAAHHVRARPDAGQSVPPRGPVCRRSRRVQPPLWRSLLARGASGSPKRTAALAATLARIETARTESDLIAAVASAQAEA